MHSGAHLDEVITAGATQLDSGGIAVKDIYTMLDNAMIGDQARG